MANKLLAAMDEAIDIVDAHRPALVAACKKISECNPDVIIALSRKGPRLLEVLKQAGLLFPVAPILTEKALESLPPKGLKGQTVVLFDDIIISGTTVAELVKRLCVVYGATVEVVAVAVDKTVKFPRVEGTETQYEVISDDHARVPVHAFLLLPLASETRFVFCERVVKSFTRLNKPYDIDFPILYLSATERFLSECLSRDSAHTAYSVATERAVKSGFERLTLLPKKLSAQLEAFATLAPAAILPMDGTGSMDGAILKSRVYWDSSSGAMSFVPIVSFAYVPTREKRFFADDLNVLNEFLDSISRWPLPRDQVESLVFRLYWYLANFVVGYASLWRLVGPDILRARSTRALINSKDLMLLFGASLSDELLNVIDSTRPVLIQAAKQVKRLSQEIRRPPLHFESTSIWDNEREWLASEIRSRLTKAAAAETHVARKLACIFEAMYYQVEVPAQKKMLLDGFDPTKAERLRTGFNAKQLATLLTNDCDYRRTDTTHRDISLSFDYLVDLGVMIPVFLRRPDTGIFERAYRYGEDWLGLRKPTLFYASMLDQFIRMVKGTTPAFDGIVPRVTLEKIAVIVTEELHRNGHFDALGLDAKFGEVPLIDFAFSRHGRVLRLLGKGGERHFFTDWCLRQGIVVSVPGRGVAPNSDFLRRYETETGELPAPTDQRLVYRFAKVAWFAYWVDQKVDESGKNEILVALTTVRSHQDYIESIREELRLLFDSPKYSLSQGLAALEGWVERGDARNLEKGRRSAKAAKGAVSDMERKGELWFEFDKFKVKIDEYAKREFDPLRYADYKAEFEPYLGWLMEKDMSDQITIPGSALRSALEQLGLLCRYLTIIMIRLLDIALKARTVRFKKERPPKMNEGETVYLYVSDYDALRRYSDQISQAIVELNENIRRIARQRLPLLPVQAGSPIDQLAMADLPKHAPGNVREAAIVFYVRQAAERTVRQLRGKYAHFESLYRNQFRGKHWEKMMNEQAKNEAVNLAIKAADRCKPEDQRKPRPKVGAVVVKDGRVVASAYRGEDEPGRHAEAIALDRARSAGVNLVGATMVTTLEPCTRRSLDHTPCAELLVERGVSLALVGQLDPNPEIRGKGILYLQRKGVEVELFAPEKAKLVRDQNAQFNDSYFEEYRRDIMARPGAAGVDDATVTRAFGATLSAARADEQFTRRLEVNRFFIEMMAMEDIRTLCVHLAIAFGELTGEKVSSKAAQLIAEVDRIGDAAWDRLLLALQTLFRDKWTAFKKKDL